MKEVFQMSGFTMGCSHALRSKGLSLAAKGLYLVLSLIHI